MTTISALPTAPTITDKAIFDSRADAFVTALSTFRTEVNTLGAEMSNGIVAQPAPTAKTTLVTLTAAELYTHIIQATPSAGNTAYTLPLGTSMEALMAWGGVDTAFDWSIINLAIGTNTVTLTANTGHTIIGNPLVAISSSSQWRTRRTAVNTFVTYRIS